MAGNSKGADQEQAPQEQAPQGQGPQGQGPANQESIYRNQDAETIVRKYWAADYLVDLVMMVGLGLVVIAAAWIANQGQPWSFIIATVIAFVVFTALSARRLRNFSQLQGILMLDCDSQKMEQVCRLSAKRTKKGAERTRFRTLHGMALALNNKPQDALDMVDDLQKLSKLQAADLLNVKSVQATAYCMAGNADALAGMVDQVQALHDSLPQANPLKGAAGYLLAQLDFSIALEKGDWQTAEHALEHVESQAAAPERLVEAAFNHARLLDAQGQPQQARAYYQKVAATGGTLAICAQAQDWLAAHPAPAELQA